MEFTIDPAIVEGAPGLPDPSDLRVLRHVSFDGYRLLTWDACKNVGGRNRIGYAIWKGEKMVASGDTYAPSSAFTDSPDGDECTKELLSFFDDDTCALWGLDEHEDEEEDWSFTDLPPLEGWAEDGSRELHNSYRHFIGSMMCNWHASSGDPIYAVGSFYLSDRVHPQKWAVGNALEGIQRNLFEVRGRIQIGEGSLAAEERNIRELTCIEAYLTERLVEDYK